jgi:hypothetical protein
VSFFLEISFTPRKLEIKARTNTNGDVENSSADVAAAEYSTLKLLAAPSNVPGCARYVPEFVPLLVIMTIDASVNEARAP